MIKISYEKLCNSCKHQSCCTNSVVPLVFSYDFEKLKSIGKSGSAFVKEIKVGGRSVNSIKKKENSNICVFWDEDKKGCSIYQDRPLDCKVYPFDIYLVDGKYHWILYSCNPDSNWEWTEEHLQSLEEDEQFNELMENIELYNDYSKVLMLVSKSQNIPFKVLREVRYKKN